MNLTEQIEFLRRRVGVHWPRKWRQALWDATPATIHWKINKLGTSTNKIVQTTYLDEIEWYCVELAIKRLDPPRTFQQMLDDRVRGNTESRIIGNAVHTIITQEPEP